MKFQRILVSLAVLALAGCASQNPVNPQKSTESANPASATDSAGECVYTPSSQSSKAVDAPPAQAADSGTLVETIKFKAGEVKLNLDRAAAPCTVNNFQSLAAQGYFNNTKCHRLATDGLFMLQCGDPTGKGAGGPGYTFPDELNKAKTLKHYENSAAVIYPRGTIAMANAGPNTNGSQFFLVFADSPLPPQYTVFGTMDEAGIKVVEDMAGEGQNGEYGDGSGRPNADTTILSVVGG